MTAGAYVGVEVDCCRSHEFTWPASWLYAILRLISERGPSVGQGLFGGFHCCPTTSLVFYLSPAIMSTRRGIGLATSQIRSCLPKRVSHPVSAAPISRTYTTTTHSRPREARLSSRKQLTPQCLRARRFYASEAGIKKTQLYDFHVDKGGKMVEFGGYLMPVQYGDLSIKDSHVWTREKASLFDVSHM